MAHFQTTENEVKLKRCQRLDAMACSPRLGRVDKMLNGTNPLELRGLQTP